MNIATSRALPGRRLVRRGPVWSALLACALGLAGCGAQTASDHYQRAWDLYQKSDVRGAIIELKSALGLDPKLADARELLGQAYVLQQEGAAAQKELEHARKLGYGGSDFEAWYLQALLLQGKNKEVLAELEGRPNIEAVVSLGYEGYALAGLGKLEEARTAFARALELEPGNELAQRGLAQVAFAQGRYDEARKHLEDAVADGGELRTWLLKGDLETALHRIPDARKSFEQALAISKQQPNAERGLARLALLEHKPDEAKKYIDALAAQYPKDPTVYHLRAVVAQQKGDLAKSRTLLQEALSRDPRFVPALLMLGGMDLDAGSPEQATQMLKRFVAERPHSVDGLELLGVAYLKAGQPRDAIDTLLPANAWYPKSARLAMLLGGAYMNAHQYDKAQKQLERAVTLQPKVGVVRTELAKTFIGLGDRDRALVELQQAVKVDPKFIPAALMLVMTDLRTGAVDKAIASAQEFAKAHPESPLPYNLMGLAYEAKGDHAKAREYYRKASDKSPDFLSGLLNIARLDAREGKREQAHAGYEKVLARAGAPAATDEFATAALALARMDREAGHADRAKQRATAVLSRDKDNLPALLLLARIAGDEHHGDEGVAYLERAAKAHPDALAPRLVLATYYYRKRVFKDARTFLDEARKLAPDEPNVLFLAGSLDLAQGAYDDAVDSFKRYAARLPRSADAQIALARAYVFAGRLPSAEAAVKAAVAIAPKDLNARLMLGRLALEQKHYADALAIANEARRLRPEALGVYELRGDVLAAKGERPAAVDAYEKALDRGASLPLLIKTHKLLREMGERDRSYALFRSWLEKHPEDARARTLLALALQGDGDKAGATREFERVREQEPDNVVALNNLALLYQAAGDARALPTAEAAYNASPNDLATLDTYGWLLLESGSPEQALVYLGRAGKLAPRNGSVAYHLASAQVAVGSRDAARHTLDAALGEKDPFPERSDAEALRRRLQAER